MSLAVDPPLVVARAHPGRRGWYREELNEQAKNLAMLGLTIEQMARVFNVDEKTIDRWLASKPKFKQAVMEGGEMADAQVARSLYERANGAKVPAVKVFMPAGSTEPVIVPYTEHYPPDTAAASKWLASRQGGRWRDKVDVNATVSLEALVGNAAQATVIEGEARELLVPDAESPDE